MNRANPSKFLAFTWLLVIGLITATNVVVANTDISAVTAAPIKPDRVILLDVAMAGKRIVAVGAWRRIALGRQRQNLDFGSCARDANTDRGNFFR